MSILRESSLFTSYSILLYYFPEGTVFLYLNRKHYRKTGPEGEDIEGPTPGEVQDLKFWDTWRFDLNLIWGCLCIFDLAPFTVFDSLSHPVLPCQSLFTFCRLLNDKLPPFVQENATCRSNKCYWYLSLL